MYLVKYLENIWQFLRFLDIFEKRPKMHQIFGLILQKHL